MTYPSFEAAQRRVEVLKGSGIWPGIRTRADGAYELTYDPEATVETVSEEDAYSDDEGMPYASQGYYAFGVALKRIAGDRRPLAAWATDCGFSQNQSDDWDALTAEWRRVIEARRSA